MQAEKDPQDRAFKEREKELKEKAREKKKIINPKQLNLREFSTAMIITPFAIDEFILSIPAIGALKDAMAPEAKISVITSDEAKPFADNCSHVAKAYAIKTGAVAEWIKAAAALAGNKYDLLINFNRDPNVALQVGMICSAKVKLAYAPKEPSKVCEATYNLRLHTLDTHQHKIVKYLNLVRFIGANSYDFNPRIKLPDEDKSYAVEFMKKNDFSPRDVIVGIHPTLKDEKKRWTLSKYSQLLSGLVERYNAKVLIFSHKDEEQLLDEFMHITNNKAIIVDTHDYFKMASIARFCSCFVCNETDFMHVFAPFTSMIVIWSDSDPEINKPSGFKHDILKPADGHADSVPVSNVLAHIKKYVE